MPNTPSPIVPSSPDDYRDLAAAIVETLREPLLVLDADLRVKTASRAFCQTFKVTPEETEGQLIYQLGNGGWNIPALRKLLHEILPTDGQFNDYHVEHDFPVLGPRTMVLNARQLRDDNKKTKLILLAFEDITDRRREGIEVARQRQWFRTTLSSIGDAVIATDIDARITFMNPTAEKLTGWTQDQATGRPLAEVFNIVNETTRKLVESPVAKALRLGTTVDLANHTILIAKDGVERSIADSAAPIRDVVLSDGMTGRILGVVMVFHDISERRATEILLKNSEIRYRRLFEAAHDGVLILDAKTYKITDANTTALHELSIGLPGFENADPVDRPITQTKDLGTISRCRTNPFLLELLDYPIEYLVGKELWQIGVFKDKDESEAAIQKLHREGSIRYQNLPLQDRNGRRRPVEVVANIYQEDLHPVIQCNIRDSSVRERFDDDRRVLLANEHAARMEAEAANRAKDIFLATLSHELRTPLNAILGWAGILRDPKCSPANVTEGVEVIERNCKMQAQLIEDVLDIARIVSGKLRLEIRPCDLASIINEAVKVVRAAAEAKGIHLEVDLDLTLNKSPCDAVRMQQIVWNILANAVKFTPKGGTIKTTLTQSRSTASIRITDTGQGISAEFLPYVFELFRQADGSTRRKFGGLGLGLSIVKQLVELHGGTVDAQSDGEGKGATFTVVLPIPAVALMSQDPDADPAQPAKPVRLDGVRVLVVDDEPDARRLIHKVLGEVGAAVMLAGTVREALKSLAQMKGSGKLPNILISDLAMPDQDGFDLIREVRRLGHTVQHLPAIALTASVNKEFVRNALLGGFQVHVPKPVDSLDLIAVVASLTGRTGALPQDATLLV